jgi:hypothetical protein
MKYIALTVLLLIMQADPAVPRKAPNNSAQAATNIKDQSQSNQTDSQKAPTPAKGKGDRTAESDSNEQHPQNAWHDITVSKLPPVTINPPKRDLADWGYWAFSGLLVIVGGLQVWLLFKTLTAIQRQGDQMEHQTKALRRQGVSMRRQTTILRKSATLMEGRLTEMQKSREIENKTLILQYRPKLIVRSAKALQFSFDLGKPWECEFEFTVVNTGGAPAYIGAGTKIVLMSCIAHDIGSIDLKEGDTFWPKEPISLQPGEEMIVHESLPTGAIFDLDWENFRRGIEGEIRRYIFLFSRIYYTDDLKIPRSTGVNRRYDAKTKTFIPKKDEEEEYAD